MSRFENSGDEPEQTPHESAPSEHEPLDTHADAPTDEHHAPAGAVSAEHGETLDAGQAESDKLGGGAAERDRAAQESRVSVINESDDDRADDEEYKWHTGAQRPHGAEDA